MDSLDELQIPLRLTLNNKYDSCMSEDADKIEKTSLQGSGAVS